MAEVLKLADIDQTAGTAVNLLSTDWQLREGSWKTRTAPMKYDYTYATPYGAQAHFEHFELVTETMDLISPTAAEYVVRQKVREIQALFEAARKWHGDAFQTASTWLYWNCDNEDLRRSLVYDGRIEILNDIGISPFLENARALLRLVIVRHPLWEPTGRTTIMNLGMNALGGSDSWLGVAGDVPARMYLSQTWAPPGAYGPMNRVWVGIREEYDGFSNFNPTWECEDGTNGTDATDTGDGTASDGNKVRVSFATPTLAERMSINVYQVATANSHSDYDHFRGQYLVLCRCQVTAGTIGLEMRTGSTGSSATTRQPMIYLENTTWQLVELGTMRIPLSGARGSFDLNTSEISLWAERIDGSGSLDLDALVLIPSQHMLRIEGGEIQSSARGATFIVHEDDSSAGLGYGASYTDAVLDIDPTDWYLPIDNGMIVVAGTRTAGQTLTDQLSVLFSHYPRWLSYRQEGIT